MAYPIENLSFDSSMHAVTGRKAARSLKLFRGDGVNLDGFMENDDHNETPIYEKKIKVTEYISDENKPLLEPVSSATYIPHTPVLDNIDKSNNSRSNKSQVSDLLQENHDTDHLQHLMADLEFDEDPSGGLTKIQKPTTREKNEHELKQSGTSQLEKTYDKKCRNIASCEASSSSLSSPSSFPSSEAFPLTVELRPFKNKVGGHTAIFRFSERAVCKALMNRENLWYEAVEKKHLGLCKFMPKYIGVLNVRYSSIVREEEFTPQLGPLSASSDHDGDISEIASVRSLKYNKEVAPHKESIAKPTSDLPPEVLLDDNRHMIPDLLWKKLSNSAPSSSSTDDSSYSPELYPSTSPELNDNQDFSIGSTSVNQDLQAQVIQEVFVPRSRKEDVFVMGVDTLGDPLSDTLGGGTHQLINPVFRKHTRFERYILLEDLTADMKKPCALDLKMGTRQYGVDATDVKQASQRKKCASTTSRELGVRVCGLQTWNKSTKSYYMRDKYFGRKLKSGKQFAKVLAKFLFDGVSALSIAKKIPSIIAQLEELYLSFQDLVGYRMYGSSVLLMYDGAASLQDMKINLHIIDFAQSAICDDTSPTDQRKPPANPSLPDRGYLKGLRSLIYYYKKIYKIVTGEPYDERTGIVPPKDPHWVSVFDETSAFDPFDIDYYTEKDDEGISD